MCFLLVVGWGEGGWPSKSFFFFFFFFLIYINWMFLDLFIVFCWLEGEVFWF